EIDAQTIAAILDSEFAIEVRAGLHCAAKIHEASGHPSEGVVRVSAGPDTTAEDLARLEAALREIAGS
ncbi:MAG: aminotransferase class V-fold PLP-dependent enzyme, partial [Planctomycetota bacterium]